MDGEARRSVGRGQGDPATERHVLDFSEPVNPDRPDGVSRVYQTALSSARSYPQDDYCEFRVAAGEYVGCEPRDVVPTAGGLAAVRLALDATVEAGDDVLVPVPSITEYEREVRLQGATPEFVPYEELPDRDPDGYAMAILCNPNNATGEAYRSDRLRAFAERCRDAGTILLVDESLVGFLDRPTMAGLPGVVVARSLSNLFGLPGLRMGFAVATGDLGDDVETARRTWNLSTPAAHVGEFCMGQSEFVERTRERIRTEQPRLVEGLSRHFDVVPSDGPFLLVDVGDRPVEDVVQQLHHRGVAVRDVTTFRGLDSHVQVSAVRRPDENDQLLDAVDAI